MIHAICDFCGKDADLHATYLTMTPFENFGRYHHMTTPFGVVGKTQSFCLCSTCREKKGLPNPYANYHNVENLSYSEPIDAKSEDHWLEKDIANDPNMQKLLGKTSENPIAAHSQTDTNVPGTDPEDVYLLGCLNTPGGEN